MTILYPNFSTKIPKLGIFVLKFRHFRFSVKFWKSTNMRVLISNTTKGFFLILAQKYPNQAFLVPNLGIFVEGTDFKYGNIVFKFQPQITQIRHFWCQLQAFLLFHEILQLGKFEGGHFEYDNSSLKLQPHIIQYSIFAPKYRRFCFKVKFSKQSNFRVMVSNMAKLFSNSSRKIHKPGFFAPKFKRFC